MVLVVTRTIHTLMEKTEQSSCVSAKTLQQDSSLPVYLQRKMVVSCLRFLSSSAINQLEDSQLAWPPPPNPPHPSRPLVPSMSINVDSCQSQRESMREKKPPKNPIIPPLWLKAVWMIGYVESERLVWGLLASCLTQPPFCSRPIPCCLLPCSFTVSLCCFYVIHFLKPCHRLLRFCLPGV